MHKLLAIVGPTATHKTQTAIQLAQRQPSILISADSRQVYRGMDIVTGKDHPQDVTIYGIDLVDPDESYSVSLWYDAVFPHIEKAWQTDKLPIVVGGTGLYVKALTEGIPTMSVPINQPLRDELALLSVDQLQSMMGEIDPTKYATMNHSDQNNPRRLIRALEISQHKEGLKEKSPISTPYTKILGFCYYDNSNYRSKVHQRVMARIKLGAVAETQTLLKKYDPSLQSMSAIGYKSIIQYLSNQLSHDEMVESWVADELSYAKRQLTWFRKQNVIWYYIDTEPTISQSLQSSGMI